MALDLIALRSSLRNLINKNNTTTSTYDISASLKERVQYVIAGYSKAPITEDRYPVIFVELKSDTEAFDTLGMTAHRRAEITFDIVGCVNYGLGLVDGRDKSDIEMIQLGQNLKNLLRAYPTLSNTAQQALVTNTEYDVVEGADDTYQSICKLTINCVKKVT